MTERYHIVQVEAGEDELWFILDTWLHWYSPFQCEEAVMFAYVALTCYHGQLQCLAWFNYTGTQVVFPSYAPVMI